VTRKTTTKTKRRKRLAIPEKPNLIINIKNLKCEVDADPEMHSEDDIERLQGIIDVMTRDIWIDRTYVAFKGNRWKDAFINEEMWYKYTKAILKSDFGTKGGSETREFVNDGTLIIALAYLYDIASKYGFCVEDIEFSLKKRSTYKTAYVIDERKDWRF
jgi:hypothetical protein